ncbi:PBP1A family penicillin-binding protein, partial [Acidobacteria bacterium AH-259-D05]|nr:PBP1A family penicillin-binding protein [Acidobacteria bacterium AH-259-D05]
MTRTLRKFLKQNRQHLFWATYALLVLAVVTVGMLGGLLFGYVLDLPEVEQLQEVRPNIVSYVYSDDGRVLGQFALEKRTLVSYEQIPTNLKNAILAAEDADFFTHSGIDFQRLGVTVVRDILYGERKGASTLTMQLSKLLFTGSEKTIERKIKDMLFALEIEKNYSKEQIFTFYCNQIYMGHGTYGVASAAELYFNKSIEELTLAENALLAGIIQVPGRHSPINHPEQAMRRRNSILQRMYNQNQINTAELQAALSEPLLVRGKNYDESPAPYFTEWVRQYLEKNYSTKQIWEGGLKIYTTLDYEMQVAARRALREGLKKFDKEKVEWEHPTENTLEQKKNLETYFHPEWRQIFYEGQMVHGLVVESTPQQARVKLGDYSAWIKPEDIEWTGQKKVDQVLKRGEVTVFSIREIQRTDKTIHATLDRIPEVQGALIAIDNKRGAIKAMVGGFDFLYSKFNRATQALRQPGSLFKPFTYVSTMEAGYSPSEQVLDAPVSFRDGLGRIYAPENSDEQFRGLITIRDAFALSRNVPTIRLANAVGIEKVIEVAHRFGIQRDLPPYLPIALGAGEVTLEEIVSAFTVFPNHGLRAQPHFIERVEDYNGTILYDHQNRFEQVLSPDTAEKMIYLLRSVVERGTARRARALGRPLGGKTGTTNDSTDSWFVGFTPQITAGVWAGYDEKKSLGEKVYGATFALPIWLDFMQEITQNMPIEDFESHYAPLDLNLAQVKMESQTEEEAGQGALQP